MEECTCGSPKYDNRDPFPFHHWLTCIHTMQDLPLPTSPHLLTPQPPTPSPPPNLAAIPCTDVVITSIIQHIQLCKHMYPMQAQSVRL